MQLASWLTTGSQTYALTTTDNVLLVTQAVIVIRLTSSMQYRVMDVHIVIVRGILLKALAAPMLPRPKR
jgi:hypothetical protein